MLYAHLNVFQKNFQVCLSEQNFEKHNGNAMLSFFEESF